jgi:hypothetical protein
MKKIKIASKRVYFSNDTTPETPPKKTRAMTLSDIRSRTFPRLAADAPHCFIDVARDNRRVLGDEAFTERAPAPRMSVELSGSTILPELSSFRPNVVSPQGSPTLGPPVRTMARVHTSPVEPTSPIIPETPAWLRPMHLIDTGGKSIYMHAHDNGPIRHALCLYCFRHNGSFRKVHRHGYEACGRTEVLDSHYWESEFWPEDSSDDSNSSER